MDPLAGKRGLTKLKVVLVSLVCVCFFASPTEKQTNAYHTRHPMAPARFIIVCAITMSALRTRDKLFRTTAASQWNRHFTNDGHYPSATVSITYPRNALSVRMVCMTNHTHFLSGGGGAYTYCLSIKIILYTPAQRTNIIKSPPPPNHKPKK